MSVDRTTEILQDIKTGALNPNGGLIIAGTSPFESEDTLHELLAQMKIMNMHLSLLTDTDIRQTEVE